MPRRGPPEFRRTVLDLVKVRTHRRWVAAGFDVIEQTIDNWRDQVLVDIGQSRDGSDRGGPSSLPACRRIAELETELAIGKCSTELLKRPNGGSKRWPTKGYRYRLRVRFWKCRSPVSTGGAIAHPRNALCDMPG